MSFELFRSGKTLTWNDVDLEQQIVRVTRHSPPARDLCCRLVRAGNSNHLWARTVAYNVSRAGRHSCGRAKDTRLRRRP